MTLLRRKLLLFILISLAASTASLIFVKTILDPEAMKHTEPEKIEDSLARIYENFLHKTKYSYETILESGTDYSNQERVFVELTKKMRGLESLRGTDYIRIQTQLAEEISKNQEAFKSFYLKATKSSPDELNKLVEERNKQFDIVLEGKD